MENGDGLLKFNVFRSIIALKKMDVYRNYEKGQKIKYFDKN